MSLPGAGETEPTTTVLAELNRNLANQQVQPQTTAAPTAQSIEHNRSELAHRDGEKDDLDRTNCDSNKIISGKSIIDCETNVERTEGVESEAGDSRSAAIDENRNPCIINSDDNDGNLAVANDHTSLAPFVINENVCDTNDIFIGNDPGKYLVAEVENIDLVAATDRSNDDVTAAADLPDQQVPYADQSVNILTEADVKETESQPESGNLWQSEEEPIVNDEHVCETLPLDVNVEILNPLVTENPEVNDALNVCDTHVTETGECVSNSLEDNEVESLFAEQQQQEAGLDFTDFKSETERKLERLYRLPDIQDIYRQVESCYRASSASPPPVPLVTYRWEDVRRDKEKVSELFLFFYCNLCAG